APRGSVPDATAASSVATTAGGTSDPWTPGSSRVPPLGLTDVYVPAPSSPGPEASPPQAVPVAPRGSAPDLPAGLSAARTTAGVADPFLPPGDLSAFAVPQGIVPTVPGVLAGAPPTVLVAPRGSAPGWLPDAPSVPDLGYLPTGVDAVPLLPDDHEI